MSDSRAAAQNRKRKSVNFLSQSGNDMPRGMGAHSYLLMLIRDEIAEARMMLEHLGKAH